LTLHDPDSEQNGFFGGKMPQGPMPFRTVAETACIKGARATDILAVVKTVGIPRTNKNNKTITDVTLIDDSTADQDGFHVEKLEHVEPTDKSNAIKCFRKLRTLSMEVRPDPTEKRSRALGDSFKGSPNDMKRCNFLHAAPSDESLNDAMFERK